MKYNEDKILDDVKAYIGGTYNKHYSTTKEGFQVQDLLRHLNIDKDFSLSNAIKYLCRYGKKNGKNKDDLFKAIHYIVLLISSEHFLDYGTKEESDIDTMLNLENEMTRGK